MVSAAGWPASLAAPCQMTLIVSMQNSAAGAFRNDGRRRSSSPFARRTGFLKFYGLWNGLAVGSLADELHVPVGGTGHDAGRRGESLFTLAGGGVPHGRRARWAAWIVRFWWLRSTTLNVISSLSRFRGLAAGVFGAAGFWGLSGMICPVFRSNFANPGFALKGLSSKSWALTGFVSIRSTGGSFPSAAAFLASSRFSWFMSRFLALGSKAGSSVAQKPDCWIFLLSRS